MFNVSPDAVAVVSIPQDIIDTVRERVSLVELASEYVALKRSGRTFVGLCPFHAEKTPSFHVNEEEGFFHCFGCGKKGTAFQFLMEMRGFSFPEALRMLAAKVGVRVPEAEGKPKSDSSGDQLKVLKSITCAAQFLYHSFLREDPAAAPAREYLRARGLSEETLNRYLLGFAPESWDFILERVHQRLRRDASQAQTSPETLKAGLIAIGLLKSKTQAQSSEPTAIPGTAETVASERGHYDFFRGRLVFPISRSDGLPIAFGGRIIKSDPQAPKYLNTCESRLYAKRRSLYGLYQALPSIRKEKRIILVEGYMDVLSLAQRGIGYVLAGCGTAVTPEHAKVLGRLVDRVVVVFDGDAAGRKAAASCFEAFLNSGVEVSAAMLPEGEDPDSLAQGKDHEELESALQARVVPIASVYIDHLLGEAAADSAASGVPVRDAAAIGKAAERYVRAVSTIVNPVEQEVRLVDGARLLGVSEGALKNLLGKAKSPVPRAALPPVAEPDGPPPDSYYSQPVTEVRRVRGRSGARGRFPHRSERSDASGEADIPFFSSAPRPEAGDRAQGEGLEPYFRQLVVAVLCQRGLAASISEIPSLMQGPDVFTSFPQRIRDFLGELIELEERGERDWELADAADEVRPEDFPRLQKLLRRHGLEPFTLIEEAVRQSKVGGSRHAELVREAGVVTARKSLKDELVRIRKQESSSSDTERLEQLAQEKLLKRRHLDRIKQT